MSRVVVVIDSNTGAVIDVAGNKRETGRYAKFVKRMLSLDKNPTLNFGANGGDTLTISKNGNEGAAVNIQAKVLNVSGVVKANGQTLEQIAVGQIRSVLNMVYGTDGEIDVSEQTDETGQPFLQISLNASIINRLTALERDMDTSGGGTDKYVTKAALATAIEGITIEEEDGIDEVKEKFATLLSNLSAITGDSSGSSSGSGEG
jgi:hypothetical protein